HLCADVAQDVALQMSIVEKRDVLRPRDARHHAQAMLGRSVEQIRWRNGVRADGVHARIDHQSEVAIDLITLGKLMTIVARREAAVRYPPYEPRLLTDDQELPSRARPCAERNNVAHAHVVDSSEGSRFYVAIRRLTAPASHIKTSCR